MITRSHTSSHDTSYTAKHDHMSHDPSYVHIKHQPSHTDNIQPQPLLLPLWIPCCKANLSCFEHMWDNSKPLVPVVPTVDSYCPGIPLVLLPLSILFLFAESPLSTLCQGILTWCSYMAFLHGIYVKASYADTHKAFYKASLTPCTQCRRWEILFPNPSACHGP